MIGAMSHPRALPLAQALIRAASPSGREAAATAALLRAFEELGFDEATLDRAGNAVGVFRRGEGPTVMLNGHLDTVPLGDAALWPHPPLSGAVEDGKLWGRGACDMKSALACMAVAAAEAADAGIAGTLIVTGVVQEEVGGLGARFLGEHQRCDVVVLGEPSNLDLMLGHRGRLEVEVTLPGAIAHAAKASLGDNALYHAAAFLKGLETLELPTGGPLIGSSATPTRLRSFPQESANVVPGSALLTVDYRNIPGDERADVIARLQALAPDVEVEVPTVTLESETGGVSYRFPHQVEPYLAPGESRAVETAREVLAGLLKERGRSLAERTWWFATDAPHLASMGAVVVGFGPGDEELAHTTREHVPVEHLEVATEAYLRLARAYLAPRGGASKGGRS